MGIEKRREPRADGTLHVRYHHGDDTDAWLAGGGPSGDVRTPDPWMNFSPIGIAFDDLPGCVVGDLLHLEVSIPGEPRRWRCAARVVRVSPIPFDERDEQVDATHRIAVSIVALPEEGVAALRAYTAHTRQANGHDP